MRVLVSSAARTRALWLAVSAAAVVGGIAILPGADAGAFLGGIPNVSAAAAPNPLWLSARETPALASIKGTAVKGTAAAPGPSANVGQTIQLKGAALAPGAASFPGYNGAPVTAPLTSIKVGKKGKAVVPQTAITGGVSVVPDGGAASPPLPLQIVPTISSLSTTTVTAGGELTITGTGFDPGLQIAFPGVAARVTPTSVDSDSAVATVPAGVQKGKITVVTVGGTSNTAKVKVAAGFANHLLATDPTTGLILSTDDMQNTLSSIDPSSGSVLRTTSIPEDLEWISVLEGTRILALGDETGARMYLDLETWQPADLSGVQAKVPSMNARGDELPVENGRVVLDGAAGWTLALDPSLELAKRTPDGHFAVALAGDVGRLYVIDLSRRAVIAVRQFDGPIEGVAVGLDGRAYTIDRATGTLLSAPIE